MRGLGTKVYPVLHRRQHVTSDVKDNAMTVAAHYGSNLMEKMEGERGRNLQG